jgi:ubiquinone/menaquinone biosynthesis C-methylase UbiE
MIERTSMTDKRYRPLRCILVGFVLLYSVVGAAPAMTVDEHGEVVRLAELMQWKAGTVVADIGAGNGQYSFVAAGIVGPSGRVYATEIDQQKLKSLREELTRRKLDNVIVVESAADDTKLPSNCCDVIFLRRVYHHLTNPRDFDKNLVRSLKVGGQLAIIDFPPDPNLSSVEGVPKNRSGHGIAENATVEELTSAGLHLEKKIDNWANHDYCVIFSKIDR